MQQQPLAITAITNLSSFCLCLDLFQEKKIELKESLIAELEDRKKHLEGERGSIELTGGKTISYIIRLFKFSLSVYFIL